MFWQWIKSKLDSDTLEKLIVYWFTVSLFCVVAATMVNLFSSESNPLNKHWPYHVIALYSLIFIFIVILAMTLYIIQAFIEAIKSLHTDYQQFKLTYEKPKRKRKQE